MVLELKFDNFELSSTNGPGGCKRVYKGFLKVQVFQGPGSAESGFFRI